MFDSRLKLSILALSLLAVITLGSAQGFSCSNSSDCGGKRFWQAAPEYASGWKTKMHLLGYLGYSGLER